MSVKWKGFNLIPNNYGDDLNVFLLERLTRKKVLKYNEFYHFNRENILCIGSILEYSCNKNSIIWGSGSMYGNTTKVCNPKKVCALRGPYTKKYLESFNVDCPDVYGDPALLLPLVYNPYKKECTFKLGIIPHYVDFDLPHVKAFREEHPEILFINMQSYTNWHEIIDKILSCERIASSSLHGMIISDAYNVPNTQLIFSNKISGGDFKFRDYCAGVQRKYKKPIDCSNKINIEQILENMTDYKSIEFDPQILINSSPFTLDNNEVKNFRGSFFVQ